MYSLSRLERVSHLAPLANPNAVGNPHARFQPLLQVQRLMERADTPGESVRSQHNYYHAYIVEAC